MQGEDDDDDAVRRLGKNYEFYPRLLSIPHHLAVPGKLTPVMCFQFEDDKSRFLPCNLYLRCIRDPSIVKALREEREDTGLQGKGAERSLNEHFPWSEAGKWSVSWYKANKGWC